MASRVEYVERPFVGEPYRDSGYGRTLADLMRQRGDREAAMHLQRGDIAAQGWANAGNTIANTISGWQRNVQENRQLEMERAREGRRAEAEGLKLESARMDMGAKKRATEGAETYRSLLPLARRENGVVGYDRDLIRREMEASGHGDLMPQIDEQLNAQEESYRKVLEVRRETIAGDAWRVLQGGDTSPETFNAMIDLWGKNDLAPKRELDLLRKAAEKEGPERALLAAVESSPRFSEMLQKARQANAPDLGTVAPGSSVYDKRRPEAGVMFTAPQEPKTPTNIEDAILQATDPSERQRLIDLKKELTAAGRQPAQPAPTEPLVSIMGDDGQSVLVPRTQAIGKRPASTREVGRQVTSGDSGELADFQNSLDELEAVRGALKGNKATGVGAQIGAALWKPVTDLTGIGIEAKQKDAVIKRVRQVIGKALEGGVLRKEDEKKYADILPTIADPPELVSSKLDGLKAALEKRIGNKLDSLSDAGYDTTRFQQRQAAPAEGGPVRMTAPDGRTLMVPADKVDEAKRRGAKVAG